MWSYIPTYSDYVYALKIQIRVWILNTYYLAVQGQNNLLLHASHVSSTRIIHHNNFFGDEIFQALCIALRYSALLHIIMFPAACYGVCNYCTMCDFHNFGLIFMGQCTITSKAKINIVWKNFKQRWFYSLR